VALSTTSDLLASQTDPVETGDVPVVQLHDLLARYSFERCTLICDIEGAEIELVNHEGALLTRRVQVIVLEEHPEYCSADLRGAMVARLEQSGFSRIDSLRKVSVLRNRLLAP
jgi:hypothetical protein